MEKIIKENLEIMWSCAKRGEVEIVENGLEYEEKNGIEIPKDEVRKIRILAYSKGYKRELRIARKAVEIHSLSVNSVMNCLREVKEYKIKLMKLKGQQIPVEIEKIFSKKEIKEIKDIIEISVRNSFQENGRDESNKTIKKHVQIFYRMKVLGKK